MIPPLTITSRTQGKLNPAPKSDADYWQKPDTPAPKRTVWRPKIAWPNWLLRRRADRA